MTDLEIKYVKYYLSYIKTEYAIDINQEDFIYDIDSASLVRDSSTLSVNYANTYKKYLKTVSLGAYKNNFSYSCIKGTLRCYEHKAFEILFFYELMMVSILKSSIFIEYSKDMPIAEVLYAGLQVGKYMEEITPIGHPMTAYEEMIHANPLLNSYNLCDDLLIQMHEYKNAINKKEAFKRISLIYYYIDNDSKKSFSIRKKAKLCKVMRQYLKLFTKELAITKRTLIHRMKESANELGNYSKCITDITKSFAVGNPFKDLRNNCEEHEEILTKLIKEFVIDIEHGVHKNSSINSFIDFEISEMLEGGEKNA